jgi:3-deoxy-D-manno-octulosonic acid (KDO) 8-phosphate synthase
MGAPVSRSVIAAELKRVIQNQLDDCKRAIKDGTRQIALNELDDAVQKLKRLAAMLEQK